MTRPPQSPRLRLVVVVAAVLLFVVSAWWLATHMVVTA